MCEPKAIDLYHSREKCRCEVSCPITRRNFLKMCGLGILPLISLGLPPPEIAAFQNPRRRLSFYNTHTAEKLTTTYYEAGEYLSTAIDDISYILRDHRTHEVMPIDTDLLDLLHAIRIRLKTRNPFHIISGYRSPKTNALLCERNNGVVRNSLHVFGKAADIRLPGHRLSFLKRVAVSLKGGGVGYYPQSDFIHVDVGRVRYW